MLALILAAALAAPGETTGVGVGLWGWSGTARTYASPAVSVFHVHEGGRLVLLADAWATRARRLAWTATMARLGVVAAASLGPAAVRVELGAGPCLGVRHVRVVDDLDAARDGWSVRPGVRGVVGLVAPVLGGGWGLRGHLGVLTAGLAIEHELTVALGRRW